MVNESLAVLEKGKEMVSGIICLDASRLRILDIVLARPELIPDTVFLFSLPAVDNSTSLIKRGRELVEELKSHVIEAFSRDPRGGHEGKGLGNSEIERLAGLEISLDRPPSKKQEHWLTWTIVQRLLARSGPCTNNQI